MAERKSGRAENARRCVVADQARTATEIRVIERAGGVHFEFYRAASASEGSGKVRETVNFVGA